MAPDLNIRWQDQKVVKKDGNWTVDGRPGIKRSLIFQQSPANTPNHYYLGMKIVCPPNSATPPHTHGGAAVAATVVRGHVVNQMVCPDHAPDSQGTGAKVYAQGESWYEPPGCHHVRSENASADEEAEFVAWFVVEKETVDRGGLAALVVLDAAVDEAEQGKLST